MGSEARLPNVEWTEEDCLDLESMLKAGLSAKAIGKELNRSRNSIIGKARRLGLQFTTPQSGSREKAPEENKKKKRAPQCPIRVKIMRTKTSIPLIDGTLCEPTCKSISILDLGYTRCRAVVSMTGGHLGTALYCGEETREGISFCDYHCSIYYQPRGFKNDSRSRDEKKS